MESQKEEFDNLIEQLASCGALDYMIVIGSWCEHLYGETGILSAPASIATQDVDFLIPNIKKPSEPIDVPKVLEQNGFVLDDTVMGGIGLTKFFKKGVLEVEFLVKEKGKGKVEPYDTMLGVTAQGLRNMEILTDNTIHVTYKNHPLEIPTPAAYIVHKLVINENRLPEYKQEKDAAAVRRIFHMADSSSFRKELLHIYGRLFPKQRKKFLGACERYGLRQIRDAAQGMGR